MNTTLNTHASIIINININIKLAHEIKKLRKDRTHLENDFWHSKRKSSRTLPRRYEMYSKD